MAHERAPAISGFACALGFSAKSFAIDTPMVLAISWLKNALRG
jgi:hypothetical protein